MIQNQNCQLTILKYFMYLLFEGCVVFQQLPPPLASLNYSHKRTMTSLGVLGQTKSHWLIQSVCPLNICPPKHPKTKTFKHLKKMVILPYLWGKVLRWWNIDAYKQMNGIFVDFPSKIFSDFLMLTSLHFQSVTQSCHKETYTF